MKILLIFLFLFLVYIPSYTVIDLSRDNKFIKISVDGEVRRREVLEVPVYSTVETILGLVELNETADLTSISRFTVLKNGDTLVIPAKVEMKKISINHSSKNELMRLPGIGDSTADKIIEYRQEHGYFQQLDDLKNVKGIGESKFNKLIDVICL
ncbi:MAG: ComEA family DNA-binding protein [Anaerorhabdus sp.]|uniref:ComEA family DNA-binding protein n=1 Tax=Anaerorhabdus sp. TaxID=1872524 RepID=UPI002FC6E826